MKIRFGKTTISFQKKILALFGIIPLVMGTAVVPVDCPFCYGTGEIGSQGMENVLIMQQPEIVRQSIWDVSCGSYRGYQLYIKLFLRNDGSIDADGLIELQIVDTTNNFTSESKHVSVFVGAGKETEQIVSAVWVEDKNDNPSQNVYVKARVNTNENTPCETCRGSGKVALNTWALNKKAKEVHDRQNVRWERNAEEIWIEELEPGMGIPIIDPVTGREIWVNIPEYEWW